MITSGNLTFQLDVVGCSKLILPQITTRQAEYNTKEQMFEIVEELLGQPGYKEPRF